MNLKFALAFAAAFPLSSCTTDPADVDSTARQSADPPVQRTPQQIIDGGYGPTNTHTPIGLAIDIEDGVGQPISVREHQTFYVNQIDMRAHLETTVDDGVAALSHTGDFAHLDWTGTQQVDESFENQANADGTFTRRRFYREAAWMNTPSAYYIEQLDERGNLRGIPVVVADGPVDARTGGPTDTWFARRLRGIQWANNCLSKTDCTTASDFTEEALVELRYSNGPMPTFRFDPQTTQLRVVWTANPFHPYTIPVTQVKHPEWDYGFNISLKVLTPADADGTYHAGETVQVEYDLTDGAGKSLAPDGNLPTFADYQNGTDAPGIDYWNEAEPHMTYYRRKHREHQFLGSVLGPMQNVGVLHENFDFIGAIFDSPDDSLEIASPDRDGFYAAASLIPNGFVLLGIDPANTPIGNTYQFTLPDDAGSGTYKIAVKARRTYLGQDIPRAAVLSIQVGTTEKTAMTLDTSGCEHCHTGANSLQYMSHGFTAEQRDVCTTCHLPLFFEPEGPVYVRVHFIHSRSGRLGVSPEQCSLCHLSNQSIQRTSMSACLSCHKSWPASHTAKFGPISDMYIGTSLNGSAGVVDVPFQQCTTQCHRTHPNSGL